MGPIAGQGDAAQGARLGTDTAFPRGQETSASDSHMGLSVTVGWEAGTGGALHGWGQGVLPDAGWPVAQKLTLRAGNRKAGLGPS